MGKLLTLVFVASLYSSSIFSQGVLSGKLQDSSSKQILSLATITVFKAKDTSIITYRLSDPKGDFRVPGLPLKTDCRVVITFSGYRVYRKEFALSDQQKDLNLGTIALVADASSLDEVIVTAERPPVSVKKDTIEFNAAAFKTLPTALVEDLLKKLPGVDVDKEGNITVNGRSVNRILVDGKDFFGGDPKVATKNLPADIIDKIQVTDDKDQLNQDPDINKANLGQVINLKLKRSIKQGWFGKAYAGAGTDERYETGAIVNLFRDTFQVSVLGYTNNLNRSGFALGDIQSLGGFQRSGYNSLMVNSDGGFALNDISFGGTGSGIQRSTGAGFNMNHQFKKNITANFQYFFGHINSQLEQISNIRQFFDDTILNTRNITSQNSDDYNHRFGGQIRWKLDSLSEFIYNPKVQLTKNISERILNSSAFSNYNPKLNEGENSQRIDANQLGYSHNIGYNKRFKKTGRSFFISNFLNTNSRDNNQFNDAVNIFYDGQSGNSELYQLRERYNSGFRMNFMTYYLEPIIKNLSLRVGHTAEYFKDEDNLNSFNRDPVSLGYDLPNVDLSNGLERSGWRNTASTGLKFTHKQLSITPSANWQWLDIRNSFLKNPDINQNFFFVFPGLQINWKQLYLNYNGNAQEPTATDLQPVVDNSNPLYLNLGNPSLVPSKNHNINLGFFKYNPKTNTNFNLYSNLNIADNAIIRERIVDEKGVQITRPINVDGVWRYYGNIFVNRQFKNKTDRQFSIGGGLNANYNRSVVIVNGNRSTANNTVLSPNIRWAVNFKDKVEFNQRYSIGWNKSNYQNPIYPDLEVLRHNAGSELIIRMPTHWVWESSIDYLYNPQIAPGIRKSAFRWNAAVNFLFLKNDKGQFKLSAYDLLNQNINVYRNTRENFIEDVQTTILTRYFLLTFTYNIRDFKGGKVGGRERLFFF